MKTQLAVLATALSIGLIGCGNPPAPLADAGGSVNGLQLDGAGYPGQGAAGYPGAPGYGNPYGSPYGAPNSSPYGAPGGGYGQQSGNPQQQIQSLLSGVAQNYQRNTSFQAAVTVYVKNLSNGQSMSGDMDYWFQKPNSTALYVKDSSDTASVGTKIIWMGGDQVAVRTKFIGFWVNTSLSLTDSRLADVRGDSLADTSVPKMMSVLLDPQAQDSIVGNGSYMGQPVTQISVVSRNSLPGVTNERFTIDTQTMMPVIREMYQDNQLTYRIQLQNVQINQPDPSAFTLTGTT